MGSLLRGCVRDGLTRGEISSNLCEIDDSEIDDDDHNTTASTSGKSVKWANSIQSTQV